MAKKTETKEVVTEAKPLSFPKEKIIASKKYGRFSDYLKGNLEDGKSYTFDQVDDLLKIMKGIGE